MYYITSTWKERVRGLLHQFCVSLSECWLSQWNSPDSLIHQIEFWHMTMECRQLFSVGIHSREWRKIFPKWSLLLWNIKLWISKARKIVLEFVSGSVSLPTGSGKVCSPLTLSKLRSHQNPYSIIIVVSPLVALIKDQLSSSRKVLYQRFYLLAQAKKISWWIAATRVVSRLLWAAIQVTWPQIKEPKPRLC